MWLPSVEWLPKYFSFYSALKYSEIDEVNSRCQVQSSVD